MSSCDDSGIQSLAVNNPQLNALIGRVKEMVNRRPPASDELLGTVQKISEQFSQSIAQSPPSPKPNKQLKPAHHPVPTEPNPDEKEPFIDTTLLQPEVTPSELSCLQRLQSVMNLLSRLAPPFQGYTWFQNITIEAAIVRIDGLCSTLFKNQRLQTKNPSLLSVYCRVEQLSHQTPPSFVTIMAIATDFEADLEEILRMIKTSLTSEEQREWRAGTRSLREILWKDFLSDPEYGPSPRNHLSGEVSNPLIPDGHGRSTPHTTNDSLSSPTISNHTMPNQTRHSYNSPPPTLATAELARLLDADIDNIPKTLEQQLGRDNLTRELHEQLFQIAVEQNYQNLVRHLDAHPPSSDQIPPTIDENHEELIKRAYTWIEAYTTSTTKKPTDFPLQRLAEALSLDLENADTLINRWPTQRGAKTLADYILRAMIKNTNTTQFQEFTDRDLQYHCSMTALHNYLQNPTLAGRDKIVTTLADKANRWFRWLIKKGEIQKFSRFIAKGFLRYCTPRKIAKCLNNKIFEKPEWQAHKQTFLEWLDTSSQKPTS
ncbi:MAG: hypothetical protein WCF19_03140 [Chlamydiales bacterium]